MTTPRSQRRALAVVVAVAVVGLGAAWVVDRGDEDADVAAQREALAADAWTVSAHAGVGTWVDVYDWTDEFTGSAPTVGVDEIDEMADAGVDTLYLQTAHARSAETGVVERDRLEELIDRAHERGLHVVAWYLPALVDPKADLKRLTESADLDVDGLAVDIESVDVRDVARRNLRLLQLTAQLRAHLGADHALAAITPSPVHLQVVNPAFWPGFPWAQVGAAYDVILPMSYWSIREPAMQDGEQYAGEDIDRVHASTGDAHIPVHVIGGIADGVTVEQVAGMVRAAQARGAIGASLYDWATSSSEQWDAMAPLAATDDP